MRTPITLILGRDPIDQPGGGQTSYARAHARAAAQAGFEPHLFSVSRQPGVLATEVGTVHRVWSPLPWSDWQISVPGHAPLLTRYLAAFLARSAGPHLIHGFGLWGYIAVIAARRAERRGIRAISVVSLYDTMANQAHAKLRGVHATHGRAERVRRWLEFAWVRLAIERYEETLYRDSRAVLVNYESVARLYRERYGPRSDVRRIPYTAETAFTRPAGREDSEPPLVLATLRPADAPLVVTVSRHDPRKGLNILLHALHRVQERGIPFRACLVGPGTLLEAHRRLALQLGLAAQTAIVGWVPDPYAYLRHADVYVLPSLGEGSGSVSLIEALQAGRPVVASACDGVPEDVEDGSSALLVVPGSVESLSDALTCLLTDEPLRRHLARGARETFAARFSPTPFVEALRATYADLGIVP
jgi:glycosyltransferase involved in cell wall biosynthesis